MARGLGFILDPPEVIEESRVAPLHAWTPEPPLVGLSGFAPSRDWRHLIDAYPDQGRSNSCVGKFIRHAVFLAGAAQKMPVEPPSSRWAYDVARYRAQRGVLVDQGCSPSTMLHSLRDHGLVGEKAFPWTPPPFNAPREQWDAFINEEPDFTLDVKASVAKLTSWLVINDPASSPDRIRVFLDKGHFPGIAIAVHESFEDYNGSDVYDEPRGDLLGHHMLTCVGYRPGAILVLNSWGTGWGDYSCAWLSDRFIQSAHTVYRCAITAAPIGLAT